LIPQLQKLVEKRRRELDERGTDDESDEYRAKQEQYFGRFFSLN